MGDDLSKSSVYSLIQDAFRNQSKALLNVGEHLTLLELIQKSYFRLISLTKQSLDGEEMIELRFESVHDLDLDPNVSTQKGVVLLRPKYHHIIKRAEIDFKMARDMGHSVENHEVSSSLDLKQAKFPMPPGYEFFQNFFDEAPRPIFYRSAVVYLICPTIPSLSARWLSAPLRIGTSRSRLQLIE